LKVVCLASVKSFTINLACKVDCDTVTIRGGCILRPLVEGATLFAKNV